MIDHPISHELLAMFDRAVRDPYQAPVLVALLMLLLVTVQQMSGWLFEWVKRQRVSVRIIPFPSAPGVATSRRKVS